MPPDLLKKWASSAEKLIAADGGANLLTEVGFSADVVVGDLDSANAESLTLAREIYRDEDQTYTDCDKLLRLVASRDLVPLTLVGVEGDRLDHVFSSVHSVARSSIRSRVTFALRGALAWVVGPGVSSRRVLAGRTVSLIPLQRCVIERTEGLRWPLDGRVLDALELTSVSNETTGSEFRVSLESGLALMTVEFLEEEFPIWETT